MNYLSKLLENMTGNSTSSEKVTSGSIVIKSRAIIISNAIYQTSNISNITLLDLYKPLPAWFWVLVVLDLISFILHIRRYEGIY